MTSRTLSIRVPSIAVLPFGTAGTEPGSEYFGTALAEEFIFALSRISELKVSSRRSSFLFESSGLSIPEIGRQLGVATILEGRVRLQARKLHFQIQLIDVAEDYIFWSGSFQRSMDAPFEVQDELSRLIGDQLREHLGLIEIEDQLVEHYDLPFDLYQQYLKGRNELMKLGKEDSLKGIAILEDLDEKAPDFPLASLSLNQAYTYLGTMGLLPASEAFAKAGKHFSKAARLAPDLPETLLNFSWNSSWAEWDFKKAYEYLTRALHKRKSDTIYVTMSNLLATEGKFEAAHTYINKALELDPFSSMNNHYKGFIYYMQENYQQSITWCQKSIGLSPKIPFPYLCLGFSYLLNRQVAKGKVFFESLSENDLGDLTRLGGLSLSAVFEKDKAGIAHYEEQLQAHLQGENRGSAWFFLTMMYTRQGDLDKGLEWVEKGLEQRFPNMLLMFTEPMMRPLHNHPKVRSLRQSIFGDTGSSDFSEEPKKYKRPLLSEEQLEESKTQLEKLMKEEQPYLDSSLSLRSLANLMKLPPHHLSQLLNVGLGKNFSEYVNTYRVESFKERASNPKNQHLTILAIAYDAGFNSKTVFNTYFKKVSGQTPRQFWKNINQE